MRVAGSSAILAEVDPPVPVIIDDLLRFGLRNASEEETVREADHVGGEPVAPDVRRLPDALPEPGSQRLIGALPIFGAAFIMFAVRADEIELRTVETLLRSLKEGRRPVRRLIQGLRQPRQIQSQQVFITLQF